MNAIIADLLFMARPVDQPQAYVDLQQIIRSSVSLVRAGVVQCPLIEEDLDPIPPVCAYASKLGQVFLNVLRNAVQAVEGSPDGAVRVRARAATGKIEVTIEDNGPGISSELLARVAQPFFTTKPHGTGLGLWVSRGLMAQHGGSLDIQSVENKGTTVTLLLPQAS
jgi:signal transduction histidine kinase